MGREKLEVEITKDSASLADDAANAATGGIFSILSDLSGHSGSSYTATVTDKEGNEYSGSGSSRDSAYRDAVSEYNKR